MLEFKDNSTSSKFTPPPNASVAAPRNTTMPSEQATIGRSLLIKGELSGAEALYIDGRVEGSIQLPDNRLTVGRNGSVAANITAKEVVVMGKVNGNIHCTDRVDIRSEGSVTGDVITPRISVEDGAFLKGSVDIQRSTTRTEPAMKASAPAEEPKAAAAFAGA